jgi:hypothetical protein
MTNCLNLSVDRSGPIRISGLQPANEAIDERLLPGKEILSRHILPIPIIALNLLIKKNPHK